MRLAHSILAEYPSAWLLNVPNPPFRRLITPPPTSRSTTLLLSFPPEVLRLIFMHGASTLIPKPGATSRDSAVLDRHRKEYLCIASLVAPSWCVEAQLEILYYTLCKSLEDLDALVTTLERTGHVKHLKRLSWRCAAGFVSPTSDTTGGSIEDTTTHSFETYKALQVLDRLRQLEPVLDELEISEVPYEYVGCTTMEDFQYREFLPPILVTCCYLVLDYYLHTFLFWIGTLNRCSH